MDHFWHQILKIAGTTNPSGAWYLLWSGIGQYIRDGLLVGTVYLYSRSTCDFVGCHRLGFRKQSFTKKSYCPDHESYGVKENQRAQQEADQGILPDDPHNL